jgi:hypothetical protein
MTKPRLHLVSDKPDLGIFADLDKLRLTNSEIAEFAREKRPAARQQKPRGRFFFAWVPVAWLVTPEQAGGFPAWVRLYLILWFRTHRGTKPVALTNAIAAEAGLDKRSKLRRLVYLEKLGLVTVIRRRCRSSVVTVHPMPPCDGRQPGSRATLPKVP